MYYFKNISFLFILMITVRLQAQTVMISGNISTHTDLPMAGVTVEINTGESTLTATTDEEGIYRFEAVSTIISIRVLPKEDDYLNGVSSLDFVVGARHILGLEGFDNPTDYIAMDLNKSGNITAFDLVEMRQLILGSITEFRNNDAWRFFEESQLGEITISENNEPEYVDNTNEFLSINNLQPLTINFIGIKIGDVSGNATP